MADVNDPRVTAIRSNPRVGRGSCTSIDECYSDSELIEDLDEDGVETTEAAVTWALKSDGLWRALPLHMALDRRGRLPPR